LLFHRAERLYKELPQLERQMLGELLDGFETALEVGNKEHIEGFRAALREFMEHFDPGGDDSAGGPSDQPDV
jgi:hypothetical protein